MKPRVVSLDANQISDGDIVGEPGEYLEKVPVITALKQSREALLACYNSVDPRSPAGKQLALALEMIKEILG